MEKHTDKFKTTLEQMLKAEAGQDPLFAESMKKEKKNMDECCDYVIEQVQKSGRCGFDDSEILCMAKHYWDEDDLAKPEHHDCEIVVNQKVELTDEEKAEARQEAMKKAIEEEKKRMSAKPKHTAKKETSNQTSLF